MATNRVALAGEVNGDMFDRYSLGHFAFGVLLALGRVPPPAAVGILLLWETSEDWLKDRLPSGFPYATHDSPAGYVGDILSGLAGYVAIQFLPPPPAQRL